MKIYIICPVRGATEPQKKEMERYVADLEAQGDLVHYPDRDTKQDSNYEACLENAGAMAAADEIHIFWHSRSTGSHFDLGFCFALRKPVKLIKTFTPNPPQKRSLLDVILPMEAASPFIKKRENKK